jgi:hypothetical protein
LCDNLRETKYSVFNFYPKTFNEIGDMLGDLMASVQPIEIKIYGNPDSNCQATKTKNDTGREIIVAKFKRS